jgi:hypothetical protein
MGFIYSLGVRLLNLLVFALIIILLPGNFPPGKFSYFE